MREGYSAQFGARPLKRTVERLLLLPVAKAIAGGLPGHTILRLTQDGTHVRAAVVSLSGTKPRPETTKLESESANRLVDLQARYDALKTSVQSLMNRKSELIAQTREASFFQDSELRTSVLNEIHNLDHFVDLYQGTGTAIRAHAEKVQHHKTKAAGTEWRHDAESLEKEIAYLGFVAACKDARDLVMQW